MKWNKAVLTMCLFSGAALAQNGFVDNQERTLSCENHERNSNRVERCEVREQTLTSTGFLKVNADPNGGVAVKGWSQAGVLVRSKVEAWGDSASEAQSIFASVQVHATPGEVTATGVKSSGERGWSVSYEVFVPHKTGLDLQATNGGMHVSDVGGTMNLHTVNGGLHLSRLNGEVTAETVNGGVHVDLAGDHWEGQGLEASSTNGSVHVSVPASYSARFDSSTVNGSVRSDFAELAVSGERNGHSQSLSGSLGHGGASIHAATTNGSVSFQRQ